MQSRFSTKVISLLIFLSLIIPCLAVADISKSNEPIRIGSILFLTGEGAAWENASRNGIDLAIEDINAKGGINGRMLQASHNDDKGKPREAISAFRKLTDVDKVSFIIGTSWSNTGEAILPLIPKAPVIVISPSLGIARFNESHHRIFNTKLHDAFLSAELGNKVYDDGHRKVALISTKQVWVEEQTAAFRTQFEKRGGEIVYFAEPLPDTRDLKIFALKIKNLPEVDAFVSTTDGIIVGSLLAKSLMELGVKMPMYSITLDQPSIDAAGGGFDGLKFLSSLTPAPEFKERYESTFKTPIDNGADTAYDAVMLLADAIKKSDSLNVEKVAAELNKVTEYQGVSGKIISDGKGGFTKPFVLMNVKGSTASKASN